MSPKKIARSNVERPATIVAIVPVWLQDALAVLLKSDRSVRLVACTATIQTMVLLSLDKTPDLVLLDVDERDEQASNQVRQIRAVWPDARCIALVARGGQQRVMQAAGADEVLFKGTLSKQLLTVIHRVARQSKDNRTQTTPEEKESGPRAST